MIHPEKGIVCAHCGRVLDIRELAKSRPPRLYRMAMNPKAIGLHHGLHMPQVLHPMHIYNREKWKQLMINVRNYSENKAQLYNEILGWPFGAEDQFLTQLDLERAHSWHANHRGTDNTLGQALAHRKKCHYVAVGVDWGGGGNSETAMSYTAISVVGSIAGTDLVEVLYVEKMPKSTEILTAARKVASVCRTFDADMLLHDAGGGQSPDPLIVQAGWSSDRLIGMNYTPSTTRNIIRPVTAGGGYRGGFAMDKGRSIAILCAMIKSGKVILPDVSRAYRAMVGGQEESLLEDFVNIYKDMSKSRRGPDIMFVNTKAKKSDDTVHAINFAVSGLWFLAGIYPQIASSNSSAAAPFRLSSAQLEEIDPQDRLNLTIDDWLKGSQESSLGQMA